MERDYGHNDADPNEAEDARLGIPHGGVAQDEVAQGEGGMSLYAITFHTKADAITWTEFYWADDWDHAREQGDNAHPEAEQVSLARVPDDYVRVPFTQGEVAQGGGGTIIVNEVDGRVASVNGAPPGYVVIARDWDAGDTPDENGDLYEDRTL